MHNNHNDSSRLSPLKICLLGYRSDPYGGGQGIYLKYLSSALRDLGHEVDVISGQPYPQLDDGVRLIKLPGLNLYERGLLSVSWRDALSLTNVIEWVSKLTGGFAEPYCFGRRVSRYIKLHGQAYDVIHDNQSLSYGVLTLQREKPLVMTIHHPITNDFRIALGAGVTMKDRLLTRRWYSFLRMQKKVAQRLRSIVTVSELSKRDIADDFDLPLERISVLYNGIDTNVFKALSEVKRLPRRLMATASADQPMKGLAFLLTAYAELLTRYPDLELLVVGKPKEGGDTEALISRLQLEDKVQFVKGISTQEMVAYYAEATVAVVPSLYEGFGLPAGEAMACGVPLVSTTGGALPEVVGDAGVLIEPGDAKALERAIEALLNDPDECARLSQAGRDRIEAKFSWHTVARSMETYYREVIHEFQQNRT
ncbi:MAG: glycosyltransferase family 4 protein [Pseudomonadota bacterium]